MPAIVESLCYCNAIDIVFIYISVTLCDRIVVHPKGIMTGSDREEENNTLKNIL
jgi:hypothetical protein